MNRFFCAALCLFGLSGFSEEVAVVLTRSDSIPSEVESAPDAYFEGYLQSLVDMHYSEFRVIVIAKGKQVWLAHLPKNKLVANSIVAFIKDVPGVKSVEVLDGIPKENAELREQYVQRPTIQGIWFPQMTELFQPLIGSPRSVTYSVGWRSGDRVMGYKCANFALGDDFPVYRWLDVYGGDLQVGIEAGIWCVFNMDPTRQVTAGTEMVNTDYYVGIPITYARGQWSFRLRGYHISSHLGDEYIINHVDEPTFERLNPSIEAIDLFASYQATDEMRFYVGPGVVVHSDPTYRWKPMYIEYGTEARFFGRKFKNHKLHGSMFATVHFRNSQELKWNFDGTYRIGYELSKMQGIGRKFRCYIEYHSGYSQEGQFSKQKTHYMQYNLNYGF